MTQEQELLALVKTMASLIKTEGLVRADLETNIIDSEFIFVEKDIFKVSQNMHIIYVRKQYPQIERSMYLSDCGFAAANLATWDADNESLGVTAVSETRLPEYLKQFYELYNNDQISKLLTNAAENLKFASPTISDSIESI